MKENQIRFMKIVMNTDCDRICGASPTRSPPGSADSHGLISYEGLVSGG